ncbi:3-hydroxyacyl-CoA dehydrogenase [Nonomuraea sp. NPDC048916]|uniref:3-hydroxyacyl-CoA dehydrogenase n=1 Tax=Nonomuraea sp. NPDC048916 TaxID=3154232 RepID=UPI0033CFE130
MVVAVVGAGTMGSGIAQTAAVAGHPVLLFDAAPGAAARAVAGVRERVGALADKGRIDVRPDDLMLTAVGTPAELAPAGLVVEAVVEDLEVKRRLFADLEEHVAADCVLATNTSSLSPTAIAAAARHPSRIVGLHFFNPAPVMRLVEVVPGLETSEEVIAMAGELVAAWGKTVVRSAATPGFIVNRIARPFYAEAWRLLEERAAEPAVVDAVLTGAGGFRMGPFALMDLIGHDVNEAVTRTVWTAFGHDPRFAPSLAQRALVEGGRLGRKTGHGVYAHPSSAGRRAGSRRDAGGTAHDGVRHDAEGAAPVAVRHDAGGTAPVAVPAEARKAPLEVVAHGAADLDVLLRRSGVAVLEGEDDHGTVELPSGALLVRCSGTSATELAAGHGVPVVVVDRTLDDATATAIAVAVSDGCPERARDEAAGLLQAAGLDVHVIDDVPGLVVARTVAMLVNLAVDALHQGVASGADIDTAMRLGTHYPVGPLAWDDRWGAATVHAILVALQDGYGDPRYRPSPLLRRRALTGEALT